VQPVTAAEFREIEKLALATPPRVKPGRRKA
jgi:hypothetical protein